MKNDDIPTIKQFQDAIPDRYFNCLTSTSLGYLLQSVLIQFIVLILGLLIPFKLEMLPIWIIYAFLSGTTAMGFWVIAHECGHGAFSKNKTLETVIGYNPLFVASSLLLLAKISCHSSSFHQ